MAPDRQAYCSACGRPAGVAGRSIDPRYPLVRCAWQTRDGKAHGHGIVPGGYDRAAIELALDTRRRAAALLAHPGHLAADRPNMLCSACRAKMAEATAAHAGTPPAGTSPAEAAPEGRSR